jgi:translation initiation factor 1
MSSRKQGKKITSGEGFALGAEEKFTVTLGDIFAPDENRHTVDLAKDPPSLVDKPDKGLCRLKGVTDIDRVVLQRQRAGRGGKTVTLVMIRDRDMFDIASIAKEIKKGLGCGAYVEGGDIVLQGDLRERAEEWFRKRGVREVVKGN